MRKTEKNYINEVMNTAGGRKSKQTWDYLLLSVNEGVFCLLPVSIFEV